MAARRPNTNEALVQRFLKDANRRLATTTVYCYQLDLNNYIEHLGKRSVLQATPEDMWNWIDKPRRSATKKDATVKRYICTLRSFYKWLHETAELMPRNPALKLQVPKIQNENPRPVPDEIWTKLWFSDLSDDMRVALGLGYFCGLRRHELYLLTPEHFRWLPQPRLVGIKRKGRGEGKSPDIYWLSCMELVQDKLPELIGSTTLFVDALKRLLEARKDKKRLFPWDDNRYPCGGPQKWARPEGQSYAMQLNRLIEKLLRENGLPTDSFTPHWLRHSFCSNLVRMNVHLAIISKLANHSSPIPTMRYIDTGSDPLASYLLATDGSDAEYGPF